MSEGQIRSAIPASSTHLPLKPHTVVAGLSLVVLCTAISSIGIDRIPVTDRDEARFAQASKQMVLGQDFIDIRFQDEPRYKKPVGIYWAQSAATSLLGQAGSNQIWAYRVPSVVSAGLATAALAWAGRPLVGPRAAYFSAVMLASTMLVQVEARLAKTDAALMLCVILVMGALGRCWLQSDPSWRTAAVFWTAIGAGALIKGPVVFLPVAGAILWIALSTNRFSWLASLRPLRGCCWMLLLVVPWYLAIIEKSGGAFLLEALGQDFLPKLVAGQENHGAPPGIYLLTFWLSAWPWCALAPAAFALAAKTWQRPETTFLIGWVLPGWVLLECIPTKLLHYPLPLFPAILLLSAQTLTTADVSKRGIYVGAALAAIGGVFWAGLAAGMPLWFGTEVSGLAIGMLTTALVFWAVGVWAYHANSDLKALCTLAVAGLGMAVSTFVIVLPTVHAVFPTERILAKTWCHSGPVHLVGYAEPSAVFRLGADVNFSTEAEALAALERDPSAVAWIVVDRTSTSQSFEGVNLANGRRLTLQLYLAPGRPASAPLCDDPA